MNQRILELALRKQRLQIRAEAERRDMVRHLGGVDAVLDTVDRVRDQIRDTVQWAREKAPILSLALLVLLVTRPRRAIRLAQRVWVGWLIWRRVRGKGNTSFTPAVASVLLRLVVRLRRMMGGAGN